MVVSVRSETTIDVIDDFVEYIDGFTTLVQDIGRDTFDKVRDPFLSELRFYPPVPPGSRYKRTFRLRRGWKLFIETLVNGFQFVVSNLTKYTPWVVGSLAKVRSVAAQFQRDFHKRNGWTLAVDTIDMWFDIFITEFETEFDSQLSEFATRRTKR
jgi:hypothetical protein